MPEERVAQNTGAKLWEWRRRGSAGVANNIIKNSVIVGWRARSEALTIPIVDSYSGAVDLNAMSFKRGGCHAASSLERGHATSSLAASRRHLRRRPAGLR